MLVYQRVYSWPSRFFWHGRTMPIFSWYRYTWNILKHPGSVSLICAGRGHTFNKYPEISKMDQHDSAWVNRENTPINARKHPWSHKLFWILVHWIINHDHTKIKRPFAWTRWAGNSTKQLRRRGIPSADETCIFRIISQNDNGISDFWWENHGKIL